MIKRIDRKTRGFLINQNSVSWNLGRKREEEKMLEGKGMIKDTDMSEKMQIHAMATASQALDVHDVIDYTSIAAHIKKVYTFIHTYTTFKIFWS